MVYFLKKLPWYYIVLIGLLIVFEVSMHPLGVGPDRRIHDPGVARFIDPQSFPGDWYADAAEESGVYPFYGALIFLGSALSIEEERWRMMLYIGSLIVLYASLIRIARVFTRNPLVVPLVALFHATSYLYDPPAWLYGPFIHIDGGLAPRSIGVALSFLAVAFFLENRKIAPWVTIGIATLIHVSNSMLVFFVLFSTLLLESAIKIIQQSPHLWFDAKVLRNFFFSIIFIPVGIYFLFGGWFILAVASRDITGPISLSTEQFIWVWVYFRAPYMALPDIPYGSWMLFMAHMIALTGAAAFLFWTLREKRNQLIRLGLITLFTLLGFGSFYLFTFVFPWLPGFQAYSFRIIYLVYAVAYILLAVTFVTLPRHLTGSFSFFRERQSLRNIIYSVAVVFFTGLLLTESSIFDQYEKKSLSNIKKSVEYFKSPQMPEAVTPIEKYLLEHRHKPYLAPPDWNGPPRHASVATFKVFGFTRSSLPVWYDRMNILSDGELSRKYALQKSQRRFEPVTINWRETYNRLAVEDIDLLKKKWGFQYLVTYSDKIYPYHVIMSDEKYRLYNVSSVSK